jgi:hypothetical protein
VFRKSGLGVNTTKYEAHLPTGLEPSYASEDVLGELGSCIEWHNASQKAEQRSGLRIGVTTLE